MHILNEQDWLCTGNMTVLQLWQDGTYATAAI